MQNNKSDESIFRGELVELVLEPLSSLIDKGRLEILERIADVEDLVEMVARQMSREIKEKSLVEKKDVPS
jgi:hypothetical protein